MLERCAAAALQAGARASSLFAHRGYSIGCRLVSSVVPEREIVVRLNPDALFAFPLGDGYWSLLLDRSYQYEPELNFFLRSVTDVDYTFVDCGANFGLWSVLVSSAEFGSHPVMAVEASGANVAKLRRNAGLNGDRFPVLHRALSSRSGIQAWMGGRKHEARQLLDKAAGGSEAVETLALDDLRDRLPAGNRRFVVKLDVEGAETDAIEGGRRLLDDDTVIICEEHGADRHHTVSRFILRETRCRAFVLDPASGRFERLTDLALLDRIKTDRSRGYNVFATTSTFWEERLLTATGSRRGRPGVPAAA